jgi:hypothetical protein
LKWQQKIHYLPQDHQWRNTIRPFHLPFWIETLSGISIYHIAFSAYVSSSLSHKNRHKENGSTFQTASNNLQQHEDKDTGGNTSIPLPTRWEEKVKCLFGHLQVALTQILITRIDHLQDEVSSLTNRVPEVESENLILK